MGSFSPVLGASPKFDSRDLAFFIFSTSSDYLADSLTDSGSLLVLFFLAFLGCFWLLYRFFAFVEGVLFYSSSLIVSQVFSFGFGLRRGLRPMFKGSVTNGFRFFSVAVVSAIGSRPPRVAFS